MAGQDADSLREPLFSCLEEIKEEFSGPSNTEELRGYISDVFPLDDYKIVSVKGDKNRYKATIDCEIESQKQADIFIEKYQQRTNETLRIVTPKALSEKNEFDMCLYYRCQHKTQYEPTMNVSKVCTEKPSKRMKNTNCPFSLSIKIRHVHDRDADKYPGRIDLEWNHNHPVSSAQALTFKDISKDSQECIMAMFKRGYTPALAYREFLKGVQKQVNNDLELHSYLADRSKAPSRRDFNNLYTEYKKIRYGSRSLTEMFSTLNKHIEELKKSHPDYSFRFQHFNETENQPFILVAQTPIMKRVHEQVATSGELIFFDSSSNMEEYNLRVFVMVTHSPVGALPSGIIVTSDETCTTLIQALDLFKECLPKDRFAGRGKDLGPLICMTDNCGELRDALQNTWPKVTFLLCIFHVLQQVWRWLVGKNHSISQSHRQCIINLFKATLYEKSEENFETMFEEMLESNVVSIHPNLISYLQTLYDYRTAWALCYRQDLRIRSNNTNNNVESQFLVLKDEILNRTKEVDINGLFEKLLIDIMDHYKVKLLGVASGKFDGTYAPRFKGLSKRKGGLGFKLPKQEQIMACLSKLVLVKENIFLVPSFSSDNKAYLVDMSIGICECETGKEGGVCKHQYILWANRKVSGMNFLPYFSSTERQNYAKLAIGESMPLEFYEGIHDRTCDVDASYQQHDAPDDAVSIETKSHSEAQEQCNKIGTVEKVTVEESKQLLHDAFAVIEEKLNSNNPNLISGVVKFCQRVKSYPSTRLSSGLHSFGTQGRSSLKVTATNALKKVQRGKIYVQPEAVKRRKTGSGSRKAEAKGLRKRKNPFENLNPATKRVHKLSTNIINNEAVSKKAGRSMASKTRFISKSKNKAK